MIPAHTPVGTVVVVVDPDDNSLMVTPTVDVPLTEGC